MSLLDLGLAWFEEKRVGSLSEPVTVITSSGSVRRDATVIDPESNINSEGVRVVSNTYIFLFTKTPDWTPRRGEKIRRHSFPSQEYQVVEPPRGEQEYNDANNHTLAVHATLCSSQN